MADPSDLTMPTLVQPRKLNRRGLNTTATASCNLKTRPSTLPVSHSLSLRTTCTKLSETMEISKPSDYRHIRIREHQRVSHTSSLPISRLPRLLLRACRAKSSLAGHCVSTLTDPKINLVEGEASAGIEVEGVDLAEEGVVEAGLEIEVDSVAGVVDEGVEGAGSAVTEGMEAGEEVEVVVVEDEVLPEGESAVLGCLHCGADERAEVLELAGSSPVRAKRSLLIRDRSAFCQHLTVWGDHVHALAYLLSIRWNIVSCGLKNGRSWHFAWCHALSTSCLIKVRGDPKVGKVRFLLKMLATKPPSKCWVGDHRLTSIHLDCRPPTRHS